ncbi:hypothetical protein GOP47_0025103 [Adiantum capillus-veneris]|uniref:RING-type domain-containing protein n=1 Tax=Adiantum capillus-veneris TaxID=13818 RepID=A0A9D4Z370_ADICA|nr:hypothetical protein GOP47_0025103 [Adiantum capillus-veneris]
MKTEALITEALITEARRSSPSETAQKPAQAMVMAAAQLCPICLNSCFHSFCFQCILQWAEMVFTHPSMEGKTHLDCPLCRRTSSCIIHSVVLDTFQRHYLFGISPSQAWPFPLSPAHYQRLYVYKNGLHTVVAQNFNQKIKCRRNFLYVSGNANVKQWIRRELQALMQVQDVVLITLLVLEILRSHEDKQRVDSCALTAWMDTMLHALKPFLFENAEIFCVELQIFRYSGLNVKAYDLWVEETLRKNTLKLLPTINCLKENVSECSSQEAHEG